MARPIHAETRPTAPSVAIMPLPRWRLAAWKYAFFTFDVALFLAATAYIAMQSDQGPILFSLLSACCVIFLYAKGQYSQRQPAWDELGFFWSALFLAAGVHVVALLSAAPAQTVRYALSAWLLLGAFRVAGRLLLKAGLRALKLWRIPTVIVGTGRTAREAAMALTEDPSLGFDIQSFVAIEPSHPASIAFGDDVRPVAELDPGFLAALRASNGPHIVIALEEQESARVHGLVDLLVLRNNAVDMIAPLQGVQLYGLEVNHLLAHELLLVRIRNNLASRGSMIIKSIMDYSGALLLAALSAPLIGLIALLLVRTGRPLFYAHERVGRNGKTFPCFKFRTMVPGASERLSELLERDPELKAHWHRTQKLRSDPRITKLGRVLRRTSLDELPQLLNVLRGEMSLVGPRPVMADELARYGSEAEYYLQVKPGITGLWQVSGRNDLDYEHRVFLDVWYVKNWSVLYDCAILMRTPRAVLRNSGAY